MSKDASTENVVIVGTIWRHRGKRVELLERSPEAKKTTRPLRVARTLALAHVFRDLIDAGVVQDQVELASLTGFTRARITQVLDLTLLAPDIQEEILTAEAGSGGDMLPESTLRLVTARSSWDLQRTMWNEKRPRGLSHRAAVALRTNTAPDDLQRVLPA